MTEITVDSETQESGSTDYPPSIPVPRSPGPNDSVDSGVASIKTPPQSIEAEQSVLGGLMLDSSAWDDVRSEERRVGKECSDCPRGAFQ